MRNRILPFLRPGPRFVYGARPAFSAEGPARLFRHAHRAIAWAQEQADRLRMQFVIELVQPRACYCATIFPGGVLPPW